MTIDTSDNPFRDSSTMTESEVKQWASFKEIMSPFFEAVPIRIALELGAGHFSTPYLAENCSKVISYENYKNWYDEISTKLKHIRNLSLEYSERLDLSNEITFESGRNLDLVFVDHSGDRKEAVETAMQHNIPYIFLHDFEIKDWLHSSLPEDYILVHNTGKSINPTALFTNNYAVSNYMFRLKFTTSKTI